MCNENIDEITDALNSDRAKKALNNGHLDFPGTEALSDWNTIPFGMPSDCKERLISFCMDNNMAHDVIAKSLIHAAENCQNSTKLIVFYVCIDKKYWNRIWSIFSPAFQQIIDNQAIAIKTIFGDEKEKGGLVIKLTDFLKASNVDVDMDSYKVHLATGRPLDAYFRGEFKEWQERQTRKNFPCKMVVSLIELRKNKWLFAGIYKILEHKKISDKHISYSTELLTGQDDLIGRIVVHHKRTGRPTYLKGKKDGGDFEVSEILPRKLTIRDFPGHQHFGQF